MLDRRLRRLLVGLAALSVTATTAAAAPPRADTARAARITPRGVGQVRLGKTFKQLHARHLVRRLTKGCPLSGPNARSAALKAPLDGGVTFTMSKPRKVTQITVTGGARARGVGIGAGVGRLMSAFPSAVADHSTDNTFGITLYKIPKRGGGKLQFAVSVMTKEVTLIGIPFVAFCE